MKKCLLGIAMLLTASLSFAQDNKFTISPADEELVFNISSLDLNEPTEFTVVMNVNEEYVKRCRTFCIWIKLPDGVEPVKYPDDFLDEEDWPYFVLIRNCALDRLKGTLSETYNAENNTLCLIGKHEQNKGGFPIDVTEEIATFQLKATDKMKIGTGNVSVCDKPYVEGYVGEDYTTEPKNIPEYRLVQERYPENAEGQFEDGIIYVTYYYQSPATVTVNYYDIDTKEDLSAPEEIKGFKGDEYTTQEKKFQYYELVEVEGQREGTMQGDTTVDYKYRKMKFNLKIDKTIAKININGREIEVKSELGKAEIQRAQIEKAQIKVEYTIKVTNDSQIAGSAELQENIPDTMTMAKADNPDWKIGTTQAILETQQIQPGQTQEYKVTMQWQNAETTVGTKLNTAEIIKTTNPAGFEETSLEDNKTAAELIIAIGTGETNYILITAGIMLILLGAGVVIYKKRS